MITFDSFAVAAYVADKIGVPHFGRFHAIGVVKNGKIVGGAVINNYTKNVRCSVHCAGEGNWLDREFLFIVFDYVFNQLGCKVVINTVESDNVKSVAFTQHIGFKLEHEIQGAGVNENLVILSYRKAGCKWILNEKYIRKYYALRPLRNAPSQSVS